MRAPSTKALIVLAALSFVGIAMVDTDFYPAPVPVLGSDGLPIHRADGKVLVHRDMAPYYRMRLPAWILSFCCAVFIIWLLVRFICFLLHDGDTENGWPDKFHPEEDCSTQGRNMTKTRLARFTS